MMPVSRGTRRAGIALLVLILIGVAVSGVFGGLTLASANRSETNIAALRRKSDRDDCKSVISARRQKVRDDLAAAKDDRDGVAYNIFLFGIANAGKPIDAALTAALATNVETVRALDLRIKNFPPIEQAYARCPKV